MKFCENNFNKQNNFKNKLDEFRERLKKNITDEIFIEQINSDCSCCYSTKFIDNFSCCNFNHKICKECVKTYATNVIFENCVSNIKCISTESIGTCIYDDKLLEKILDKKVYDQYIKIKTREETKYIFSMDELNLIKCQFCETIWDHDINEKILYCMCCEKKTCLDCNQLKHSNRPCDKIRLKIEEELTKKNFLICSECSRCIVKEDGCNAVKCLCGNNMCWGCKKNWGPTDAHGCGCGNLWGVQI